MCRDGYKTTCDNCGAPASCRDVDACGYCGECYSSLFIDDEIEFKSPPTPLPQPERLSRYPAIW